MPFICAVSGCFDKTSPKHLFPHPNKERILFDTWVNQTGNNALCILDPMVVYKNYRVCHQHFTVEDITRNMYRKKTAVPSLHLSKQDTGNH